MERWIDWNPCARLGGTWPIRSKRGCPLRCSYCSYPLIEGRRGRLRDPEKVVDEVEAILHGALHALRVAPPYWRFLPDLLSFPPLHWLRSRNPGIRPAAAPVCSGALP
jgi:hypothetical protein